ncbi:SDR family NAD(P)-dependent oxidoreductase [uncultured Bilophila sp.]|uniref:SDR family NAD(P)-dependent oxidoreductase n=1 Tax=uncultured Bilophila sp. TaxID=529385 RepID=UPI00280BAB2E|nr:SDR family NAD(P)-dependent oxidoreductase [uncultured Bilophila sp.]
MDKDVIIITGSSTGIGLATAKMLSSRYTVVTTWRTTRPSPEALAATSGPSVRCDVGNYEDCLALVREAQAYGNVIGLVHSAAVNPEPPLSVSEMDVSLWEKTIHNNLTGAFYMAKAVIPALRASQKGSIVFVSSTAGRKGFSTAGAKPGRAKTAYATSKAGIIAFTKGLAMELAHEGIRVNCMAPGPIETRMLTNLNVADKIPLGRIGTPEEAAKAIIFLLEDATFSTGCTMDVCGGLYMQ